MRAGSQSLRLIRSMRLTLGPTSCVRSSLQPSEERESVTKWYDNRCRELRAPQKGSKVTRIIDPFGELSECGRAI